MVAVSVTLVVVGFMLSTYLSTSIAMAVGTEVMFVYDREPTFTGQLRVWKESNSGACGSTCVT